MALGSTPRLQTIQQAEIDQLAAAKVTCICIGESEEGRPIHGCTVGDPALPLVSIVAGAHPDEPAGPMTALRLLAHWQHNPLSRSVRLAVVPHMDVDGAAAQIDWLKVDDHQADLHAFLQWRLRRLPGADREFAWPGAPWGGTVLPECQAADSFLSDCGPAIAHLSLHGMSVAHGPWFLLNAEALSDARLWNDLRVTAQQAGLPPHEFIRYGEKGFRRVGHGFCTTPNATAMRRFFLARGDRQTADGFGLGSMDAARQRALAAHQPPPLCGISEWPLFAIAPDVADGPEAVREQLGALLLANDPAAACQQYLQQPGVVAVPYDTQVTGMLAMVQAVISAACRRG